MLGEFMKYILLLCVALATAIHAADKKPKAMRLKGDVILADDFKGEKLDEKWVHPKGEQAAKFEIVDGVLTMDQAAAPNGAVISRAFEAPVQNASIQLLVKPWACKWIAFGFYCPGDRPAAQRKINIVVAPRGAVAVHDVESQKMLKAANTRIPDTEWQRISFESKGDKITIQVNDQEVLEYKTELKQGEKAGILINLYGGKGSVGEIEVKALK
jgi:hypothetical protein